MTLNEIRDLEEGRIADTVIIGTLVLHIIGVLSVGGYSLKELYTKEAAQKELVQQIRAKNPADAEAYLKHFELYTDSLPRESTVTRIGKINVPRPGKAGNPEKAKAELKAIEDILKRNDIKKQ